jgi:hypothetical protein
VAESGACRDEATGREASCPRDSTCPKGHACSCSFCVHCPLGQYSTAKFGCIESRSRKTCVLRTGINGSFSSMTGDDDRQDQSMSESVENPRRRTTMSAKDEAPNPLAPDPVEDAQELPQGVDRRAFMMRTAMMGRSLFWRAPPPASAAETAKKAASATSPHTSQARSQPQRGEAVEGTGHDRPGGVLQGRPGPSSSHTIGPMRITYDFYQRCTKLPPTSSRRRRR